MNLLVGVAIGAWLSVAALLACGVQVQEPTWAWVAATTAAALVSVTLRDARRTHRRRESD